MHVSGEVTALWHLLGSMWGTCGGIGDLGRNGSGMAL